MHRNIGFVVACVVLPCVHAAVQVLDGSNFDERVAEPGSVWFVDFFSPWCGHCRQLEPIWAEAASRFPADGRIRFAKVDATVEEGLAFRFSIRAYPTLLLFADGRLHRFRGGGRSPDVLEAFARGGYRKDSRPEWYAGHWLSLPLTALANGAQRLGSTFDTCITAPGHCVVVAGALVVLGSVVILIIISLLDRLRAWRDEKPPHRDAGPKAAGAKAE
jgi:protein disulfide-isomerase-like protein